MKKEITKVEYDKIIKNLERISKLTSEDIFLTNDWGDDLSEIETAQKALKAIKYLQKENNKIKKVLTIRQLATLNDFEERTIKEKRGSFENAKK